MAKKKPRRRKYRPLKLRPHFRHDVHIFVNASGTKTAAPHDIAVKKKDADHTIRFINETGVDITIALGKALDGRQKIPIKKVDKHDDKTRVRQSTGAGRHGYKILDGIIDDEDVRILWTRAPADPEIIVE